MNNILIVGASSGLGNDLLSLYANELATDRVVVGVSRRVPDTSPADHYFTADMSSIDCVEALANSISDKIGTLSLVIYCVSGWGETKENFTPTDIDKFLKAGPYGLLNLVNTLLDRNLLALKSNVISIGSTATLTNNSVIWGSNTPVYSMAKEMQRFIFFEMQRRNKDSERRFTTLTVGGLGSGRISSIDIKCVIDCIKSLSPQSCPVDLTMPGQSDFVDS